MKIAAIIPVLLGSFRIPDKNLILVNHQVLCAYTIEACKKANVFSKIYLNSEDDIFKSIADEKDIDFYRRSPQKGGSQCEMQNKSRECKGSRCVINDHYLYDFITNVKCDYFFQVNATSPLLKSDTIRKFIKILIEEDYDSLFSVHQIRAESFYHGKSVNFAKTMKKPSQELDPIESICWAITGWRSKIFIESFERNHLHEEGPVFVGKLGLFPLDEKEALDIDDWSTLEIVEAFLKSSEGTSRKEWRYLDGRQDYKMRRQE